MQIFNRWELSLCPEPGIAVQPDRLKEYFALWPFCRAILSGIHAGQIEPAEIHKKDSPITRFCEFYYLSEPKRDYIG